MTCIDKLKELRPHVNDRSVHDYIRSYCPSEFGIMKNRKDCSAAYEECVACWGREVPAANLEIDIPWEFEYGWSNGVKLHCKILEQITHPYTNKIIYRVRRCDTSGSIGEVYYSDKEIREMLACRVVEE